MMSCDCVGQVLLQFVACDVTCKLVQGLSQSGCHCLQFVGILLSKVVLQRPENDPIEHKKHQGRGDTNEGRDPQCKRRWTLCRGLWRRGIIGRIERVSHSTHGVDELRIERIVYLRA